MIDQYRVIINQYHKIMSVPRNSWSHEIMIWVANWDAVAPFELKLSPNGSNRRAASF